MKRAMSWVSSSKPLRVYRAFARAGGNLYAAGMSFQALFAVFAAIWVGFSVLSLYLNGHPTVRAAIIHFINLQVPGLIGTGGLINPNVLISPTTLGVGGVIALAALCWTAVSWIEYGRIAIRRIFDVPLPVEHLGWLKVSDFLLGLGYGLFVVAGALLSVATTTLFKTILGWMGLATLLGSSTDALLRAITVLFVLLLDTALLGAMIRILSGVHIGWRFLWRGVLVGGFLLGAMKLAGSLLLGGAARNPLFASFAVVIGLLIWFNLTNRVILLTAQWIDTGMRAAGQDPLTLHRQPRVPRLKIRG